ncbi:hypothetical protein QOT17_007049 [Balamuthia mandrillaris]
MSKENAERPRGQRLPQTKPPMDDEDLFLSPTPRRRANGGRSLTSRRKSRPRSNTFAAPSSSSTPTAEPSGSKAKRGSSRERGGGGAKTITEESGKQSLGIKMEEQEDLLWRKQNENQGEEDEGTKTTTRMERGGMPEGTLANKSVGRTNVIIICCLALLMASAFVVLKQKSTEKGPYACPIPDAQWVDLLEELLLASSAHNDNSKDNLQELIDVMHRESMKDGFTSFSSSSGKPLSLLFSSSDTPFMWHVVHQIAKARFPSSSSSFSSPSSAHQQQQQQEKEARKEEGEGFVLLDQATREEMSQRVMQVLQQCPYALFVIDVDNYSNKEDPRVIEFLGALFDDTLPTIMQDEKQNGWNNHEKMHDASRSIFVLLSRFGQQKLQGEAKEDAKMVVRKAMKGQWADRFIHRISQVLIF